MQEPSAAGARHDPNDPLGLAAAVVAAVALGLAIAVARIAYEGGTNGLTVAASRALLAVLVMGAFCLASGRSLRLSRAAWWHCAGLGVLMSMMMYGNAGSVEYIPVGLAALLFYTFPPMVAVLHAVTYRERPRLVPALSLSAAFLGLCIMLGVSLESSDPRGIALALLAATATAWNAVWLARKLPGRDPFVITFHMSVISATVLSFACLASGSLLPPSGASGWLGLLGVAVLQSAGLPFYFAGIARIGPLKSAMVSNVQPVTSIVAAYLLFAEVLSSAQLFGGGLVLAAILVMQRHDQRRAVTARRGTS